MKVFGNGYAGFYDTLYAQKDYVAECDYLERLFEKYSGTPVSSVLDIGCGTGGHTVVLARRGYECAGVDLSPGMLDRAREKAEEAGAAVEFIEGDLRDFDLARRFGTVIAMFAVMGYQTTNEDVENTLRTVRRHLGKGGLFIFDIWSGPAVLSQKPTDREKFIEGGEPDERILRTAKPRLDILNHTVEVDYTVVRTKGKKIIDETKESHLMRFFFPQEMKYFLSKNGFELVVVMPFMEFDKTPSVKDWNVQFVARAC
ncbi:MAG: class I SAM-dependent methyltransferase [Deltaproteobacteria bacterium]|nr:class I SAM-dependent methyltransferase [Deltaproteobacteria bacterium]